MKSSSAGRRFRAVVCIAVVIWISASQGWTQQHLPVFADALIAAGATASHEIELGAGDVVIGTFAMKGTGGSFVVSDVGGRPFQKLTLFGPGQMGAGFTAMSEGRYRIQIISRGSTSGTYSLHLRTRKPIVAANAAVAPIVRYSSSRISQLDMDLKSGDADAVSRFWKDAAAAKGIFVEPTKGDDQTVLATFVWREVFETHNVRLVRPPESTMSMDYYLSKVAGTDIWYKTMKVHRTSRLGYSFAPNYLPGDDFWYAINDPLNPALVPIERADWAESSVFELPDAPDDTWALHDPPRTGTVVATTFNSSLLKARLNLSIYTPPNYALTAGPYPLLLLFNGPAYSSDIVAAPKVLDNLIAAGRIRAPVVAFISSVTAAQGGSIDLRLNPTLADAMATEVMPWLQESFALSASPADHIIGGFSVGANAGLFIALKHPEVFGAVLSQDGAGGVGRQLPDMFLKELERPLRVYMSHSLYSFPDLSIDELATMRDVQGSAARLRDILRAKGSDVTYREFGATHDWAYVRSTLPDALMTLLAVR